LKAGDQAELTGEDYMHLTRSLRARVGEPLRMVGPDFAPFLGTIIAINRHAVTLKASEAMPMDTQAPELVLGLCAPANEAFDAALEAAVQLGVSDFRPLISRNSRSPETAKRPRWERIVRESCCQSLRAQPLRIHDPQALEEFLRLPRQGGRFVAWQGAPARPLAHQRQPQALVVGPEGGFDDAEIALASSLGWEFLNLGPHVLRVPVAVAAGLGLLQASGAH
jgi:16S rRNA (uracil1498-N3)-methyltransferase